MAATINQPCQNIPGTAGTTSASFPAFNCQPFYNPNNGVTSTQHIQTLSLTISGASLTVNMTDRIDLSSSAGSGYCNNTYSGTFTKQ